MGRMYVATFSGVAVTAAQDFFELTAPATCVVILHSVFIGQYSDAGDSEDEMLPISIRRGYATSGSGGSAVDAQPHDDGNDSAQTAVETNNTTRAKDGTEVILLRDTFNVRAGWQYRPTPEERIVLSPSNILTVTLDAAPGDSVTMNGTLIFEEIGGAFAPGTP